MKSQVAAVILPLLLAALFQNTECTEVFKPSKHTTPGYTYTRTVKGQIVGKVIDNPSVTIPVPEASGAVECNAAVTYLTPRGTTYGRDLFDFELFQADAKGKFSVSISFYDDTRGKKDKVETFLVSCIVRGPGLAVVGNATGVSGSTINVAPLVGQWAKPLQVKGTFVCDGTSKPIRKVKGDLYCTNIFEFNGKNITYVIRMDRSMRSDGSFSTSGYPVLGFDEVPSTTVFSKTTLTCEITTLPAGLSLASANPIVVTNSANYDFGQIFLQDKTSNRKYCRP